MVAGFARLYGCGGCGELRCSLSGDGGTLFGRGLLGDFLRVSHSREYALKVEVTYFLGHGLNERTALHKNSLQRFSYDITKSRLSYIHLL